MKSNEEHDLSAGSKALLSFVLIVVFGFMLYSAVMKAHREIKTQRSVANIEAILSK